METGIEAVGLSAMADRAARHYGWRIERDTEGVVLLRVAGEWSDYDLTLTRKPEAGLIEVRCVFALAPPRERWEEVARLADGLNRSFHRGSLELRIAEDHGTYTDWVPMSDTCGAGERPLTEAMRSAVGTCDMLLFPAFHCVAWAEVTAEVALDRLDFGSSRRLVH